MKEQSEDTRIKNCKFCMETIHAEARICKECGEPQGLIRHSLGYISGMLSLTVAVGSLGIAFVQYKDAKYVEQRTRHDEKLTSCRDIARMVSAMVQERLDKFRGAAKREGNRVELHQILAKMKLDGLEQLVMGVRQGIVTRDRLRTFGADHGLQVFIEGVARRYQEARHVLPFETWAIYHPSGTMLAHSTKPAALVGRDFSYRDYMKGALRNAQEGRDSANVSRLYLSSINLWPVPLSLTGLAGDKTIYKFGIDYPVVSLGKARETIAVIHTSVTTSRSMGLPHIQGLLYKAVLVGRLDPYTIPGEDARKSSHLIVLHPSYPEPGALNPNQSPAAPVPFPDDRREILKGGQFPNYQDPVRKTNEDYAGNWLVGSAPVEGTEFVVLVQTREEAESKDIVR